MTEIARSILDAAPPRFALGGVSMGGYIAFEIWRLAPERVRGLALADTSARADTPEVTQRRRDGMALTRQGKFSQVVASTFPMLVHPDHVADAGIYATHTRMGLAVAAQTYLQQQEAIIARPDSRPDLTRISVPTVVLVGESDALTPPELSQEMVAGISDAMLATIPHAGHMALIEQPEAVAAAMLGWLDRIGD